jgi:hypothetical protein
MEVSSIKRRLKKSVSDVAFEKNNDTMFLYPYLN